MSVSRFSEPDKLYKKSTHRSIDSEEIDVFEATWYLSGDIESAGFNGAAISEMTMREEKQEWGGRKISLDMPMRNPVPSQFHGAEKQIKEKKYKAPNSLCVRLPSFQNFLFNQIASKKKKSKSKTQSIKDEDESPGGRRKRRSSISHFHSVGTDDSSKSIYSSSSSGFRTPPPYAKTHTNIDKDLRDYSDHKQVVSFSTLNAQVRSMPLLDEVLDEKRNKFLAWLVEKLKFRNGFSGKNKNFGNDLIDRERNWVDGFSSKDKNFRSSDEEENGGESDSSSDLFELQNFDFSVYSSGLPVYNTTHN